MRAKLRIPDLFLGLLLAVAIFAIGATFSSSHQSGVNQLAIRVDNRAKKENSPNNPEAQSLWMPTDSVGLYTLVLSIFTGVLALVSIFQGVMLLRADKVSRSNAEAAKKSAEIAEQSLVATQRAFIRVSHFPWVWRPDSGRPGKFFYDITPNIENSGNTPTSDMRIIVQSELRDTLLPDDFDFAFKWPAGQTFIGAHQSIGASNQTILDNDLLLIQQGKKFFYIWGTITYHDIFENTPIHTTKFCTQIGRVMGNPLDPRDPNDPKGGTVEISFNIFPKHQETS